MSLVDFASSAIDPLLRHSAIMVQKWVKIETLWCCVAALGWVCGSSVGIIVLAVCRWRNCCKGVYMDFRLSEADRVLIEHVREFGAKYFNQDTVCLLYTSRCV